MIFSTVCLLNETQKKFVQVFLDLPLNKKTLLCKNELHSYSYALDDIVKFENICYKRHIDAYITQYLLHNFNDWIILFPYDHKLFVKSSGINETIYMMCDIRRTDQAKDSYVLISIDYVINNNFKLYMEYVEQYNKCPLLPFE